MKKNIKNFRPVLFLLLLLVVWEGFAKIFTIPEYLLPGPWKIFQVLSENITFLLFETLITMSEAMVGFLFAFLISLSSAVIFKQYRNAKDCLFPIVVAFKTVPIIVIAPMLFIWLGSGFTGKIIMAILICFFPLLVICTDSIENTDKGLVDAARALGLSSWQIIWHLRIQVAMPEIFSGLKTTSALSVVGAIVAEFAGAEKGLGFQMVMATYQIDTPILFAEVFLASFSSILFFYLIVFIEKRMLRWHYLRNE